ncbi:hypothetical protein AAG570_006642 [Ranatra chinensis]|uniref:AMP-binding enzyme C-terminal domain-containing protein n=1 Tax=Ranatra chinensis TaxID=642074 RepID=A0ABD0ZHV5_9HEMI
MVPMGTAGEVWFRSYATMLGYWDDPEKTKEMITSCGWMKSGDIFVLREDGYGQVVGRLKDVIIRGGENIFPAEVEHVLETHPNVLEAQVYGVNDARMGEEVSASLKLKADAQLTKQDLYSFCLKRMARYKIPKYINFVEDFPKTESGKVKKFMLKEAMERNKNNCLAHPVGQHNT